jgi:predicted RNase H-like HicB family nuclease
MARKYTVIVERDEAGWLVSDVVELPGCHTQAKDMNQLLERTKEAIKAYLETDQAPPILKNSFNCFNATLPRRNCKCGHSTLGQRWYFPRIQGQNYILYSAA